MKLFVISDIHGHFSEMQKALSEAGFEKNNKEHLLIICGDLFDRGTENLAVLRYIDILENKVMIRGNHEDMLLEIFEKSALKAHNLLNGTLETIYEFFGKYSIYPGSYQLDFSGNTRMLDRVSDLINEMLDFYETKNYVFVHGWLPVKKEELGYKIKENWREASSEEWAKARWIKWAEMFETSDRLKNKTIVCGHYPTFFAHKFDKSRSAEDSSIFKTDSLIVIDAGTYTSGQVNVLVMEDELI